MSSGPASAPADAPTSSGNDLVLDVQDVHTYYGSVHAIKGVSLPTVAGFEPEVADRVFRQLERLLGLPASDS